MVKERRASGGHVFASRRRCGLRAGGRNSVHFVGPQCDRRFVSPDRPLIHTSGDGRRDRGDHPMSNFEPYYVNIGPAAMLAIGAIVFWLITRLPD
jgi:hypothetical protein